MKKRFFVSILYILALSAALGGGAWYYSVQQTPEYLSSATLLFIQEQRPALDPATTIKSAEKMSETFARVVMTEDFQNQVLLIEPSLAGDWPDSLIEKRQQWQSMVTPQADGSFLQLEVYHPDPKVANKIVSAAALVLMTKTNAWHGGGETVQVKIVNTPLTTPKPVRPNILLNTILGAATGWLLSCALVLYQIYFPFKPKRMPAVVPVGSGADLSANNFQTGAGVYAQTAEANFKFSDYAERVFTDRINLYQSKSQTSKPNRQQPKISSPGRLPWLMAFTRSKPAATIMNQSYNLPDKHYI